LTSLWEFNENGSLHVWVLNSTGGIVQHSAHKERERGKSLGQTWRVNLGCRKQTVFFGEGRTLGIKKAGG
jgi:hypothetical protein